VIYNTFLDPSWHGRPDIRFSLLRLDLYTQWASGNKYFKLQENLAQITRHKHRQRVLSFGGAWSNHLLALAQSAKAVGIETVGVVRGEEGFDNEMLQHMRALGMRLHFISRAQYRLRYDAEFCENLCYQLHCHSWLPEGGSNHRAVAGCEKIAQLLKPPVVGVRPTQVVAAVGTGATLAGLIRGCDPRQHVTGVSVTNDSSVACRINRWIQCSTPSAQWSLLQTPVNSYAKPTRSVIEFIIRFFRRTGIALDPVYTAPALIVGLSADFIDTLARGESVVFVHTGGLAGARGFRPQFSQYTDPESANRYFEHINSLTE